MYAYPFQAGSTYKGHGGTTNSCYLQRITQYWQPSIATWNTKPSVTTENQVILPQSSSAFQDYLEIDVTNLFLPMIQNSNKNFGIQMKLVNEIPTNVMIFCSTNYTDKSKHPKLTIYYEEDNPVVTNPNTSVPKDSSKTTIPAVTCDSEEKIYIPNSFSPNDDGINDNFTIFSNKDLEINYLRIFDRWGNLVFEQKESLTNYDFQGWNGSFLGQPCCQRSLHL